MLIETCILRRDVMSISTTTLVLIINSLMLVSTKTYSPVELNRLNLTMMYRNDLLTRPPLKNSTQSIVAIGLGIIEVAGIDPQKQVSWSRSSVVHRRCFLCPSGDHFECQCRIEMVRWSVTMEYQWTNVFESTKSFGDLLRSVGDLDTGHRADQRAEKDGQRC